MQRYPYKICHLLLGSVFMFLSGIISIENANSEPVVGADVTSSCLIFNKEADGELAVNNNNTILSSNTEDGGDAGIVKIDCEGSIEISISPPLQDNSSSGKTDFPDDGLSATATNPDLGLNIQSNGTTTKQTLNGTPQGQIKVNMEANNKGKVISPGEYKFTVTLTVTPQ